MFSSLLRVATRSTASQLDQVAAKSIPPAVAKAQAKAVKEVLDGDVKVDDEVLPIKEGMREETTKENSSTFDSKSTKSAGSGISRETPAESSKSAIERNRQVTSPPAAASPRAIEPEIKSSAPLSSTTSNVPLSTPSSIPSRSAPVKADTPTRPIPPTIPPPPPSATKSEIQDQDKEDTPVLLRASKVPSSKIGRFLHYGSLAASLSWGAATESVSRAAGGGGNQGSVFMSDANVRRLVSSLTRMRGAALKLGQFMSIQDNHMLPPEIERVLSQVQSHANYMPDWQMERVMSSELGSNWTSLFSSFDRTPIASASIGQVHRATLVSGQEVAVKIQFPGIKESITSDLSYLTPLLASSAILPKGLYLQNTIAVMKDELADECDYLKEAQSGRKFRTLLEGDEYFDVPQIIDQGCTERVLTTAWMEGKSLSRLKNLSQEVRDKIGENILRLCLKELFHFRIMQTDPNWGNFLYSPTKDKLGLIDFGASREYTKGFIDSWYALLSAAIRGDRERMITESRNIGYFTGEEEQVMINAHLSSMSLLSVPFAHIGIYDFSRQTITDDVRKYIPIMLKHRLTPPPTETYSLNRKLSGAFLMCTKLGSKVDCGKLWMDYAGGYPYPEPKV